MGRGRDRDGRGGAGCGAGTVVVTLAVVVRGPFGRPGRMAAGGLGSVGAGPPGPGLTPGASGAVAAGSVVPSAAGSAPRTSRRRCSVAPEDHLSRARALSFVLQRPALLLTHHVLGAGADLTGPAADVLGCAVTTTAVALLCLDSRPLRTDRAGPAP